MILGIDEVGRGAWAGPLVVGAACLNGVQIEGLTDSKALTKKRREALYEEIMASNAAVGLGWVSAKEVDDIGLSEALRLATRRAVEQITVSYHEIIIDGTINFLSDTGKGGYVTTLKKADLLIPSVSAASIVAKVARDKWMAEQDKIFSGYGFAAHVGYGTAKHSAALEKLGVCELHRCSFSPIQKITGSDTTVHSPVIPSTVAVTTKQLGDTAEGVVAKYLRDKGHEILARNWKTKFCEIDIVSRKDGTVYFTEVKYRKNAIHGDGLTAVTSKKQRQMRFAAEYFVVTHKMQSADLCLAVGDVRGANFQLTSWVRVV